MPEPAVPAAPTRVLICEDAPGYGLLLEVSLVEAGMSVAASATSWAGAIAAAGEHNPDLVLVDLWLPYRDDDALIALRAAAGDAVLVAISGLSVEETAQAIGGLEVVDLILSKRQPMGTLVAALQGQLQQR